MMADTEIVTKFMPHAGDGFYKPLFAASKSDAEAAAREKLGVHLRLSEAQLEIVYMALRYLLAEGGFFFLGDSCVSPEDFAEIGEKIRDEVKFRPATIRAFLSEGD